MNTFLKRTAGLVLAAFFVAPIVLQAPVLAHGTEDHSEETSKKTETKEKLEDRITDWKEKYKLSLSEKQKKLVTGRCNAVVAIATNTEKRIGVFEKKRPAVYAKVHTRLEALVPKLKAEGVDTTTLEAQLKELETKIDNFNAELADYKKAVEDLKVMDCPEDNEGFVAAVKEAVALRKSTIESGRKIRAYLKETIKPTLKQIQTELATAKPESEE